MRGLIKDNRMSPLIDWNNKGFKLDSNIYMLKKSDNKNNISPERVLVDVLLLVVEVLVHVALVLLSLPCDHLLAPVGWLVAAQNLPHAAAVTPGHACKEGTRWAQVNIASRKAGLHQAEISIFSPDQANFSSSPILTGHSLNSEVGKKLQTICIIFSKKTGNQTRSRQGQTQEFVIWTLVYGFGTSFMNSGWLRVTNWTNCYHLDS